MNIKSALFCAVKTAGYVILFFIFFMLINIFFESFYRGSLYMEASGEGLGGAVFDIYYTNSEEEAFGEGKHIFSGIETDEKGNFSFNGKISAVMSDPYGIRLDLGDKAGGYAKIRSLVYSEKNIMIDILPEGAYGELSYNDAEVSYTENGGLSIKTTGTDPYIVFGGTEAVAVNHYTEIPAAAAALFVLFVLNRYLRLKTIYHTAGSLFRERRLIFNLAVNDFKTKYTGSYFGIIWAFVQPVCTILIFCFVFQVGLRSSDVGNVPFVLWLMCGLVPWFFFSEAWNSATFALMEYSYLVKKVVFRIHILPLVKIISSLFVHIFFVLFMLLMFLIYHITPNICWLQVIYYSFSMIVLIIALSYMTASLVVFFKDLGQIMNIVLQFGMWLTPIMWQIDIIPDRFRWIFKLNPMYYIVQGYRDSLIGGIPLYNNIKQLMYFWIVVSAMLLIGFIIFGKLKDHFADVL